MQRKIGSFKAETTSLDTGLGLMLSSSRHTSAEKGDPGKELCFQVRPRSARMTLKHAICFANLGRQHRGAMGDGGSRDWQGLGLIGNPLTDSVVPAALALTHLAGTCTYLLKH